MRKVVDEFETSIKWHHENADMAKALLRGVIVGFSFKVVYEVVRAELNENI